MPPAATEGWPCLDSLSPQFWKVAWFEVWGLREKSRPLSPFLPNAAVTNSVVSDHFPDSLPPVLHDFQTPHTFTWYS